MLVGVTGGTGIIGRRLLERASEELKFSVLTGKDPAELPSLPFVTYVKGGYDVESFKAAFDGCDAIVHLGAKRPTPENEKNYLNYAENIESAINLFTAANECGIKNVVNISSRAVYDGTLEPPVKETVCEAPVNFYGVSKITIEKLAHRYNAMYGMKIKSLRLAQVLDLNERGGYMPAIFLERCLKGEPLNVYGTGKAGKEYVYVEDVVDAIIAALNKPEESGAFNIGTGVKTSNEEFAKAYCDAFRNPAGYMLLTDKPEADTKAYMDVTKAREVLGFEAKFTVREAVQDMKNRLESGK